MSLIEVIHSSTEPAVIEICELYWLTDDAGLFPNTVKSIADRYGLKSHEVTKVVTANCQAYAHSLVCPNCGDEFEVTSRKQFADLQRYPPRACPECVARAREEEARKREELTAERQRTIADTFPVEDEPDIVASELSLRSAMTLAALLRDTQCEAGGIIPPALDRLEPLTPTSDLTVALVVDAWRLGLVKIHPSASNEAFGWEAGRPTTVSLERVPFVLQGSGHLRQRMIEFHDEFEAIADHARWPAVWNEELPQFWKEIAIAEVTAHLTFYLGQHKLLLKPGDGTRLAISNGLEWFSPGQMVNFAWRAARDAAAYYSRERVPKNQAANSAVTRLRNAVERAYAEGWSIKPYHRDNRLPVNSVSQLILTRSLRLSDPMAFNPLLAERNPTRLQWGKLTPEDFERLIFRIVSDTEGYTDVDWLMKTNAPDHGRDVAATRVRHDALSGYTRERIMVQCKHWLSRSLGDDDIAKEVVSVDHWTSPPVDVLAIATSGSFTVNAVSWVERHNAKGIRPRVEMWNDAKLETLLADRPDLILEFKLR